MKEVKIGIVGQGLNQKKSILVDGQEISINFPKQNQPKELIVGEETDYLVDVNKVLCARQRHQVSANDKIVGGSYMSKEQKLTLAIETKEGEESRILTAQVNKKAGIAD